MPHRHIILVAALAFAILTVTGCLGRDQNLKKLDDSIRSYHTAMQYKQLDRASKMMDAKLVATFYETMEPELQVKSITDFQIRKVTADEETEEAEVVIIRETYDTSSYEVRREVATQHWEKGEKDWRLMGGDF